MAHRAAILNLVALSDDQLVDMPRLSKIFERGTRARLQPQFPAVTCTSQTTMLTGEPPSSHGIVGNGWHERDMAETHFWKQSDRIVRAERVWDQLRKIDPTITTANCFWWYAMYASADVSVTPRPMYLADGRKLPDNWTSPQDLRTELQSALGQFPLFRFWGPAADITSSKWIADAARHVHRTIDPTLLMVYLPHLDYGLQKLGPKSPAMTPIRRALDDVAADLIEELMADGRRILLVNEYGIAPVTDAIAPNRFLRQHGLLSIRHERGRELLDAGSSDAFVVPDHQCAHVYLADGTRVKEIAALLKKLAGVESVLYGEALKEIGLEHDRCGDIVLMSVSDRWFCHDWWGIPATAPDYQRTVDIHRKPGYDPRELFIDPAIRFPRLAIAWRLARKRFGFRGVMDVIPLDTSLVRGSHGRCDADLDPVLWCSEDHDLPGRVPMAHVADLIQKIVLE
jgi:predicted AlkP superfamily pyrophosphatase or phosphodiesterase